MRNRQNQQTRYSLLRTRLQNFASGRDRTSHATLRPILTGSAHRCPPGRTRPDAGLSQSTAIPVGRVRRPRTSPFHRSPIPSGWRRHGTSDSRHRFPAAQPWCTCGPCCSGPAGSENCPPARTAGGTAGRAAPARTSCCAGRAPCPTTAGAATGTTATAATVRSTRPDTCATGTAATRRGAGRPDPGARATLGSRSETRTGADRSPASAAAGAGPRAGRGRAFRGIR
jgi:hypothetical protein